MDDIMVPLEEVLEMLEKMRTCEDNANRRLSGELDRREPRVFYEGQANGYRNSARYVEELVARHTGMRPGRKMA